MSDLVLSLFPGIGLLDRGFEGAGFCVVRGPDLLWGGDIRDFDPPAGRFEGVIAGSPCQDFSVARRDPPTGYGVAMLAEFRRCVEAADPDWWLLENVAPVPDVIIDGYGWQRLDLAASDFGVRQRRVRHFQYGSKAGDTLVIDRDTGSRIADPPPAVTASGNTADLPVVIDAQGLPAGFDIPAFTRVSMRRAVANGVALPVAYAVARAVRDRRPAGYGVRVCGCGCGRPVKTAKYAGAACRMRMMRRRQAADQSENGRAPAYDDRLG